MRHRARDKKFGRSSAHRTALMAALVCALIERKRIKTTLPKAKEARRLAEKMVSVARKDYAEPSQQVAARRLVLSRIRNVACVKELFEVIAPRFSNRAGGYTRIIKMGPRAGDGAEMALLEWVESEAAAVQAGAPAEAEA